MPEPTRDRLLSEALLARVAGRAARYDRENAFFEEDLAELAAAGYLTALVPADLGGGGASLPAVAAAQRRLASAAGATALGVTMHLVWAGVARLLHDAGDATLDGVLAEIAAGAVLAFGVSEPGNDAVLFGSTTHAEPDGEGGYRLTGTKVSTTLSPAWTLLGTLALDTSDPERPLVVHGFLERGDPGIRVTGDWDALGMRATRSLTTVLEEARMPASRVTRRVPPGPTDDALVTAVFAIFETALAGVYAGIGDRALELGVAAARRRTSLVAGGAPLAHSPDVRRRLATAAIAQRALTPRIADLAQRLATGERRDVALLADSSALKTAAVEAARGAVDAALRVVGGAAYTGSGEEGAELQRLQRDVLAGLFQPSDDDSAVRTMATALLGPVGA